MKTFDFYRNGEPCDLLSIDHRMCEAFGVQWNPRRYLSDWVEYVCPLLSLGLSLAEILDRIQRNAFLTLSDLFVPAKCDEFIRWKVLEKVVKWLIREYRLRSVCEKRIWRNVAN